MTQNQKELANKIKRANQRLRQLEKSGVNDSSLSYKLAQGTHDNDFKSIMSETKNGEIKYRTDITKMNDEQLNELEKKVDKMLGAKTSTVRGYKETQQTAFSKELEKWVDNLSLQGIENASEVVDNMNISMEEYMNLWKSQAVQKAKARYDSERIYTIVMSKMDELKPKQIIREFSNAMKSNLKERDLLKNLGLKLEKGNIVKTKSSTEKKKGKISNVSKSRKNKKRNGRSHRSRNTRQK